MAQAGQGYEIDKSGPALDAVDGPESLVDQVVINAGAPLLHGQKHGLKAGQIILDFRNKFR